MARTAPHLVTGLAVMVTLITAGQALAAEDGSLTIVIHVENYAGISRANLSPAEAEMTRIYATAGVRTIWAKGEDHADSPGLHVRVQLLSTDMAMRKIRAEGLPEAVVGRATRGTDRAYIFPHRIAKMALRHSDDFRRLLGRVMAHEVGHLLLPIFSHADRGIMQADIAVGSKHGADFTPEQGVAIRSMLVAASRPHPGRDIAGDVLLEPEF